MKINEKKDISAQREETAIEWLGKNISLKYLGLNSIWEILLSHSLASELMEPAFYRYIPFIP